MQLPACSSPLGEKNCLGSSDINVSTELYSTWPTHTTMGQVPCV
jgi:hypothetical protein